MYYHVYDGLILGQSLMVIGVIVIVLHAKHPPIIIYGIKSLVTVSMETKRGMKNFTCDCTSRHGTRPVCKVSDLYILFTVFEI